MLVITSACAAFILGQALIDGQPGPDGLAFYLPLRHWCPAQPGQVIWSRHVTGPAALPGAAENLLILYHYSTLAGQDTAVSGTLITPASIRVFTRSAVS